MKKTRHLFNESIYHISSNAVARNFLFQNPESCKRFLVKVNQYLGPLCEILYYTLHHSEFHLIVRLKDWESFCAFYKAQRKEEHIEPYEIPLSTYIFSKAMSDLLVSTAKHFNYWHRRKGGLFARRFRRSLIESQEALEGIIGTLKLMAPMYRQDRPWNKVPSSYRLRLRRKVLRKMKERSAEYYYKEGSRKHGSLAIFKRWGALDLRGCFKNLPPKSLFEIYHRLATIKYIPKNQFFP